MATHPPAAVSRRHAVFVKGLIDAPNSGFGVFGALRVAGPRAIDLEVTAAQVKEGIPALVRTYYEGNIENLGRGEYTVRVVHILLREKPDTTIALDTTVTVR